MVALESWEILSLAVIGGFGGVLGLIFLTYPTILYDIFRIYYYKMFLTENGMVTDIVIEKERGQYYIKRNKKAYMIPFGYMIKYKCGDVFYVDKKNSMSIRIESPELAKALDEIREHPVIKKREWLKARNLLSKIPYVNRFYTMKQDTIDEVVFANKFRLNPEVILDSCILYILLNQGFTEKILAKPKDLIEMIMEHLPIIIIGIIAVAGMYFYFSSHGGF